MHLRQVHTHIKKLLGIEKQEFVQMFSRRLDELDLDFMGKEVEPFLFDPDQKDRVILFREMWQGMKEKLLQ